MAVREPDFPPLLSVGWHQMPLSELRERCVKAFPLSATREELMAGIETVVARLVDVGIIGDLWVNGSFVTEKINPKDTDVVLSVDGEQMYELGKIEQREVIDWIIGNLKNTELKCDSYHLFTYPEGHLLFDEGVFNKAYWTSTFGFSREYEFKGIAVIPIPDGAA